MLSIPAGMLIDLGAIIYLLQANAMIGSALFAIGLITILHFKLELFTGKAGLYTQNKICLDKLGEVWVGNMIGTAFAAILIKWTPIGVELAEKANVIINNKIDNGIYANFIYGIFCGLLMYIAVSVWNSDKIFTIMPVMAFILCGFNHCVADMFYLHLGCESPLDYFILIPITVGNFIGTNMLPWMIK